MMKKFTQPEVQTALAGVVNALLAVAIYLEWVTPELAALIIAALAAGAILLSVWYSPSVEWGGPES